MTNKSKIKNNIKLLGICYGAEILALTLGGTIKKSQSLQKGNETIKIFKDNLIKIINSDFNFEKIDLSSSSLFELKYNEIRPYLFFITFLNYKKTTRRRIVAAIKSFYKYLYKNNKKIDPSILNELKGPKTDQALPRPISVHEIKEIINEIKNSNEYKEKYLRND